MWRCAAVWGVIGSISAAAIAAAAAPDPILRVPAGFTIEKVAGAPLVRHPVMAALDDRGRLFVAEASGRNEPFTELIRTRPGRVVMLEDRDGDGRYDTSTVFAAGLTFPTGVLWHDGSVYVASVPDVLKLTDTDGDGKADRRAVVASGFESIGNAADLHGPYLGPDGWIYWADGRHGYTIQTREGPVLTGLAARIWRCRPDGTGIERFCGGGMDNPVSVAFTASGAMLGTQTFYHDDRDGIRDALMHYVEGGVYPKVFGPVMHEFHSTGGLLPAVSVWPAVAPAGLTRYRGTSFGPDYRDNFFTAQFNAHRVQRHVLSPEGATFRSRDEDFLTTSDPDFHPTGVLEDADGSLLMVNTGGWFQIGCPRSVIAKPDIPGGIYRIRRRDAPAVTDPRGTALALDQKPAAELVRRLADARPVVRDRAVDALVKLGEAAVGRLAEARSHTRSADVRRNAVWALGRIGGARAAAALRDALADTDPGVRQAAARSLGMLRDGRATDRLARLVAQDEPPVSRQAAAAIGQIGGKSALPSLLARLRSGTIDPFLSHSIILAILQIGDRAATEAALADRSPQVRRAALIALDQMGGGRLTRAQVAPLLDTDDPELQQAVLTVIGRHPGWSGEIIGLLHRWLDAPRLSQAQAESLRGALVAFSTEPGVQRLIAAALQSNRLPAAHQAILLEVMARCRLAELPPAWLAGLRRRLDQGDDAVCRQAVAVVRARNLGQFDDLLKRIGRDPRRPADLRIAALAAAASRLSRLDAASFQMLTRQLDPQGPPLLRIAAAEALGGAPLDEAQLQALATRIRDAGPLVVPALTGAFERSRSVAAGTALVRALEQSPGLQSLSADRLAKLLHGYPPAVQSAAAGLVRRLAVDTRTQATRLAELAPLISGGRPAAGRRVFFGPRAGCFGCHRVAGDGGLVGPDLSKIGAVRSGPDLLEAIVFPSASFAQGYEPYLIATRDGRVYTGVISARTGDAITLRTADRTEVRIPHDAIEEVQRQATSIMPQGFDTLLTPDELRDLLAFLQGLK